MKKLQKFNNFVLETKTYKELEDENKDLKALLLQHNLLPEEQDMTNVSLDNVIEHIKNENIKRVYEKESDTNFYHNSDGTTMPVIRCEQIVILNNGLKLILIETSKKGKENLNYIKFNDKNHKISKDLYNELNLIIELYH